VLRYVLRPDQDAFGHLLKDFAAGRPVVEVVERDDGCVFTGDPSYYLAPFREWWPQERRAMRYVRGCVLDLGCGAGRVGVHLQSRGFDVVGIDVSPLAVELARERGASDARLGTLDTAIKTGELFGTILLLGNNLGLLAGEQQGRRLLRRLARVATAEGRLLAGSYDQYEGASDLARRYQQRKSRARQNGRRRTSPRLLPQLRHPLVRRALRLTRRAHTNHCRKRLGDERVHR